jgi:hypothetical protein
MDVEGIARYPGSKSWIVLMIGQWNGCGEGIVSNDPSLWFRLFMTYSAGMNKREIDADSSGEKIPVAYDTSGAIVAIYLVGCPTAPSSHCHDRGLPAGGA